jgi:predicted GH43/DUF377 family glycosyl hydrolase
MIEFKECQHIQHITKRLTDVSPIILYLIFDRLSAQDLVSQMTVSRAYNTAIIQYFMKKILMTRVTLGDGKKDMTTERIKVLHRRNQIDLPIKHQMVLRPIDKIQPETDHILIQIV